MCAHASSDTHLPMASNVHVCAFDACRKTLESDLIASDATSPAAARCYVSTFYMCDLHHLGYKVLSRASFDIISSVACVVPLEPSPLPTSSMQEAPAECGVLKRMAFNATRSSSYTVGGGGWGSTSLIQVTMSFL